MNVLENNTEKYKALFLLIEKEIEKVDKYGNKSIVTIPYEIKFIDSARFMQAHYQILLIISWNKFTKLNVKIVIVFLNMKVSMTIQ